MLAAMITHAVYYYPLLPNIVAQKYDFSGKPFRFASKDIMMGIYISVAIIPLILLGVAAKSPMKKLSVPNSEYWTHEDRIGKAQAIFIKAMFSLGVAQGLFLLIIMDMMFKQNLEQTNMSPYLAPLLIVFITYIIFWMVRLFSSYKMPNKNTHH